MSNQYIPRAEVIAGGAVGMATNIFNTLSTPVRATEQASTVIVSGVLPTAGMLSMSLSAPSVVPLFQLGDTLANESFRFKIRLPKGAIFDLQSVAAQASIPMLSVDEVRGPVG